MASAYSAIYVAAAQRSLSGILVELEGGAAGVLDAAGRNYEGDTKQGIFSETSIRGDSVFGAFGSASGHAEWVHNGRQPGRRPPIEPIQRWVERKKGVDPTASRGVAFVIARKIGRSGMRGTPFLRQPFDEMRPTIGPRLARDVATALNSRVP